LNSGYNVLPNSYITAALQTYYGNSFPGYTTSQQPIWTPYVLNGQFSNQLDIITVKGVPLNLASEVAIPYSSIQIPMTTEFSTLPIMQANQFQSPWLSQTSTTLSLTSENFPLSSFTCSTPVGIVYTQSIPMIGYMTPTSTLTYSLTPTSTTQTGVIRFQLYGVGPMTNVPFTITSNNVNILTVVLNGNNVFRNVEVQFPLTTTQGQSSIPLTMSFDTSNCQTCASQPFKWGITQLATSYSNAPVGFYLNSVTGGYAPVVSSYFTEIIPIYYGKSFPGYTAAQQPNWLGYVLNGQCQFNNAVDIISINGNLLNFDQSICTSNLQVNQATNFAPTFNTQTQTIVELTGSSFPTTNFAVSEGTITPSSISSIPTIGQMSPTCTLTYQLSPISNTKAGSLRFLLLVSGNAQNVPFTVSVNGVSVLTTGVTCNDCFHNVEVQFPLSSSSSSQPVVSMNFGTPSCESCATQPFKWTIGQLAMHYSNAPLGFIFNSYNGGYSPISSSQFTPLMGVFYGSSIPGYSSSQQPVWIPYVKNGQFQNGVDIISINNAILNFGTPSTSNIISNSLPNLNTIFSNSNGNTFATQTQTILQLVGENFDTSPYTSTTSFSTLHINSVPVIGYFQPTSVVSTTLTPLSSTQSTALRFSLFLLGETVNAPLQISVNSQSTCVMPISTNGYYQNVECVWPTSSSSTQPKQTVSITFGSTNTPFQWALGQVAISYSNAPAGTIYNSVTGGNVPLINSYYTPLLQNYLGGSFPGYSASQQPIWSTYVQNGLCTNGMDQIVINGQLINCEMSSPATIRNSLIQASFSTQSPIVVELTGSNFPTSNFQISQGTITPSTISSIPVIGSFAPGSTLTYTLSPLPSTQSVNVRLMTFVSGTAENVACVMSSNGVEVLNTQLSGTDIFSNLEAQFPYIFNGAQNSGAQNSGAQNNGAQNTLTMVCGTAGSSQSYNWSVGQMAVSYSSAPVGFVFNSLNLGYSPVQSSYFTPALSNFYSGSIPGYTSSQQPVWNNYVMNGQFNNNVDVISLNGNIVNFSPYTVSVQSSSSTPLTNSQSSLQILQNTIVSSVLPQLSTVLEIVGLNFNTSPFTYNTGNYGVKYIEETPAIGNFQPSTTISYSLSPLSSTQAIVVRFNLHTIGTVSSVPLTVNFNNVNVLTTPITSTNSIHFVEVNFPFTASSSNQYSLSISFSQPSQNINNFQWAVSQYAVTYSNAPCGYVPNSVTGEYNAITTSFHSMVVPTYYSGAYPGYTTQPTWLNHVLNAQFVNSVDIVSINGTVLNFGRLTPSSVGILELSSIPQSSSSILNYIPYTQNVGTQQQYTGVTQNLQNLFNFSPMVIDLVGSPLSNIEQWTVSNGNNLNTIVLNGINMLGYFSPSTTLTRQYLNLGSYKSLGVIFHISVASPTGFNFRVQANGITILQQPLQSGTYSQILETQFEIAEQNIVLTFTANTDNGVSTSNAGGWAIGSVGFLNNQCDIKNFYNLNVNSCQYAGTSVWHPQSFVNYRQGFQYLTTQPTWHISFVTNNVGTSNQFYFINNANVPYLTGLETNLVSPSSIHQTQYALMGGNHMYFDLVGNNWNLPTWSVNTGSIQTSTINSYQVLGNFNLGQVLTLNLQTAPVHSSVTLRFRLNAIGSWNNYNFYTNLGTEQGTEQILIRTLTITNDFRDIELQIVHSSPTIQFIFGVNTTGQTVDSSANFAISNLALHLSPCSIRSTFNVLLNTCMQAGNTAIYSLYRSDYWGQFNNNAGLNLIYLNKFQSISHLIDDGKEIYSSWTGPQNQFTGMVIYELSGPNYDYSPWEVKGTRTAPYTSQLYGSTAFGPYESATTLIRTWTSIPAHTSITGRFRLYLNGAWIDQNTVLQVNGVNVFTYVIGSTDTYQDLEFAFDHTAPTIDFTLSSSAATSAGAREGIQFGISDIALYINPCAQTTYFDINLGSCSKTSGYSTFYNLVQSNLDGLFPVVETRPVWIPVLNNINGISPLAHEVYSFLKGTQLEVIIGLNGTPQFQDLDLLARLKEQIYSKPVVSSNTSALSFLSNRASGNIVGDYQNGTISNYGQNYDNLFGVSFASTNVTQFEFALGALTGWACVGMIETKDITTLNLNANLRDQSLVVCSDTLTQARTKFQVNIDTDAKTIDFEDQFYNQSQTLNFNDASDLYYTIQFYKKGTVYFGKNADEYQKN
jgi:hypothetical protein